MKCVQERIRLDYSVDLPRGESLLPSLSLSLARIGACNCARNWNWRSAVEWKYEWSAFGTLRRPRNSRAILCSRIFKGLVFPMLPCLFAKVARDCDPIKTRRRTSTDAERACGTSETTRDGIGWNRYGKSSGKQKTDRVRERERGGERQRKVSITRFAI